MVFLCAVYDATFTRSRLRCSTRWYTRIQTDTLDEWNVNGDGGGGGDAHQGPSHVDDVILWWESRIYPTATTDVDVSSFEFCTPFRRRLMRPLTDPNSTRSAFTYYEFNHKCVKNANLLAAVTNYFCCVDRVFDTTEK